MSHRGLASALAAALGITALEPASARPSPVTDEALIAAASRADFVLLGESTHGSREYYLERAQITEALIRQGVRAVAIEGD